MTEVPRQPAKFTPRLLDLYIRKGLDPQQLDLDEVKAVARQDWVAVREHPDAFMHPERQVSNVVSLLLGSPVTLDDISQGKLAEVIASSGDFDSLVSGLQQVEI